jgi:fucose 4-O-acetylase-like acetyltransferase
MRLHLIDALKGFGIILVVLAHHSLPDSLDAYIYSFHMPLFFFISGFLFDFGKYADSTSSFVKKRFRSLIVPYFCFALLIYLFYFLLDKVLPFSFFEDSTLYDVIYTILYAPGNSDLINPPLWFLPCLFVTELLFYKFWRICYREPRKLVLWIIAAGVIGYLYPEYVSFRLPWTADVALSAVVFYGAGNLFKKFTNFRVESGSCIVLKEDSRLREMFSQVGKFLPGVFILLNLLYLGHVLEFPETDGINMNVMEYESIFWFYLIAFSGIFTFGYIFKKIGSSRILEYYGRNSLIVLAFHYPIMEILLTLIFLIFGIDFDVDYNNAGIALGLTVLNFVLLVPVIYIINNYFPYIIGKGLSKSFESKKANFRESVN